jgi:predicted metal-binding transcription factor (methanogenesis marker protein 9)
MKINIIYPKGWWRLSKGQMMKKGDKFWDGDSGEGYWFLYKGKPCPVEDTLVVRKYLSKKSALKLKQEETKRVISENVPVVNVSKALSGELKPNAFVYQDEFGRIGILFGVSGWLGAKIEKFEGDQAPFCG